MKVNETNFLYSITCIRQRLFKFLERELADRNISGVAPSHGDVLFALDQNECQTVQDVAKYTNKDKSTISSVLNRLETNGYIRKDKDTTDARITNLTLTPKAKKLKPVLFEISGKMNARIFESLSTAEKETLFELIEKILNHL
jgi:DNA-binding MarR family transcriptional regulator